MPLFRGMRSSDQTLASNQLVKFRPVVRRLLGLLRKVRKRSFSASRSVSRGRPPACDQETIGTHEAFCTSSQTRASAQLPTDDAARDRPQARRWHSFVTEVMAARTHSP